MATNLCATSPNGQHCIKPKQLQAWHKPWQLGWNSNTASSFPVIGRHSLTELGNYEYDIVPKKKRNMDIGKTIVPKKMEK